MKPDDFKIQHDWIKSTPKMQADTDKLAAMFDHMEVTFGLAVDGMNSLRAIRNGKDGPRIIPLPGVPGAFAIEMFGSAEPPSFHGVALCRHCLQRAIEQLRDTATMLEDIVIEANKNAEPIK